MSWKHKLKNFIIKKSGYWFQKRKYLYAGIDLFTDIERVYHKPLHLIFDVGANVGQSIRQFKEYEKDAVIYSFEPVKSSFQKLQQFASTYNRVHLEHKALGERPSKVKIKVYENKDHYSTLNSLDPDLMNKNVDALEEEVEVVTLDQYLMDENIGHIDLLKLDVEKWEIPVLKGAEESIRKGKVGLILSEVGFSRSENRFTNFNDLSIYLESLNYSFVGLYEVTLYNNKAHFANALWIYDPSDPKSRNSI